MTAAAAPAVHDPAPGALGAALRDAAPLLLSVGLLMAGNGLTSTLLGVRGDLEGFAPGVVGVVLAGYYLGFLVGSWMAPSTIARVGHVRVFAGLASLASGAVLVHVVQPQPITWFVLRAVSGMCISALYVVCETWLNGAATNRSRGGLMATYMVVVSGSLLTGQFLFGWAGAAGFAPFVLASVLVSLAVVPVSLASYPSPVAPEPTPLSLRALVAVAPLGAVGASLSGFISAAMLGAGVVYAATAGFGQFATGAFVGAALVGGLVLQVPLGAWSDRVDRRLVIAAACFAATAAAVVASMVHTDRRLVLIALVTVAGGATFPLYSLSNAHLNDYLDRSLLVAGGARMVLVNGAGAVAGPIVGGFAVGRVGPGALFVVMATGYAVTGTYALYRITRRAAPAADERAAFLPVPVGVGASMATVADASVDDVFPVTTGTIAVAGREVGYRERGAGRPVVVVGALGEEPAGDGLLAALAADGVRAIALRSAADGPGWDVAPHVLALLRHLELPSAAFAGGPAVHGELAAFARDHPDRTDVVVLVHEAPEGPPVHLAGDPAVLLLDRRGRPRADTDLADDLVGAVRAAEPSLSGAADREW